MNYKYLLLFLTCKLIESSQRNKKIIFGYNDLYRIDKIFDELPIESLKQPNKFHNFYDYYLRQPSAEINRPTDIYEQSIATNSLDVLNEIFHRHKTYKSFQDVFLENNKLFEFLLKNIINSKDNSTDSDVTDFLSCFQKIMEKFKSSEYIKEFSGDFKNYLEYLLRDLLDNQLSLGHHKKNSNKIVRIMNFLDILDKNKMEKEIEPNIDRGLFVKKINHLLKENLRNRDSLVQFLRETTKNKTKSKTVIFQKSTEEKVENSNEDNDETPRTDDENLKESNDTDETETEEEANTTDEATTNDSDTKTTN